MTEKTRILVVDDELSVRQMMTILLKREGHDVVSANCGNKATEILESGDRFDVVVTDLAMDRGDGLKVLAEVKARDAHCPVIMVTAFGTTESAVEAMKMGAHDYIAKPFNVDEFKLILTGALEHRSLVKENLELKSRLSGERHFKNIVGRSDAIKDVISIARKVSDSMASVFISGESGTGKEVVARAIHFGGPKSDKPFIAINCGAMPDQLMESELFGHMRGAFTGAVADKQGLFQAAHGGTLFLDEVGELPPPLQVKLLRVLQERTVRPVGGATESEVDVRIISATNQNLEELVSNQLFRTDLYYRLNVIQIILPPLRDRREDIPSLVAELLPKVASDVGSEVMDISPEAMTLLLDYDYPGNVRELKNILERASTLTNGRTITRDEIPEFMTVGKVRKSHGQIPPEMPEKGFDLDGELAELEARRISQALERTGGIQGKAASLLGITVRSLRYRLNKQPNSSSNDNM